MTAHCAAIARFVLCGLVAISGWTSRALAIAGTGTMPA